jgi:hypothetical protein
VLGRITNRQPSHQLAKQQLELLIQPIFENPVKGSFIVIQPIARNIEEANKLIVMKERTSI